MEGAHLRPVPSRPPGPVDPDEAARHVRDFLPLLDESTATALALVALAGLPREEVPGEPEHVADALARGRKELRRSLQPLQGSGWCERAERLISDRLDEALEQPGAARLEVHLRNCSRCVEHERRLVQATNSLVAAFVEGHPVPAPDPSPPAELRVVEPVEEPPPAKPTRPVRARLPRPSAGASLSSLAWTALFAVAIVLAVATVALIVVGVLGGQL
jgi:Putative zinc-finger